MPKIIDFKDIGTNYLVIDMAGEPHEIPALQLKLFLNDELDLKKRPDMLIAIKGIVHEWMETIGAPVG